MAAEMQMTGYDELREYLRVPKLAPERMTALGMLRRRELCNGGRAYSMTQNLGFATAAIPRYDRWNGYSHDGCVNTASWSDDGALLVTGSDDQCVAVWRGGYPVRDRAKPAYPVHEMVTHHHGNIFCAKFQPESGNRIVYSCAADGTMGRHEVESEASTAFVTPFAAAELFGSNMIHMFHFQHGDPNTIYCAMEEGAVAIFDPRARNDRRTPRLQIGPAVKYICQSPSPFDTNRLIVGGHQPEIFQFDIRMVGNSGARVEKVYCPKKLKGACRGHHLSISGLTFSSNGSKLLASYQGDQIYEFSTNDEPNDKGFIDAYRSFGGHINYETFLKNVSYFGPNDEFVMSGSDSGNLFVWNSEDRSLVVALQADSRICNGVVPHPFYPMFVTYGIENSAKLWWYNQQMDDIPEHLLGEHVMNTTFFDVTTAATSATESWTASACHKLLRSNRPRTNLPEMYDIENYALNGQHIRRHQNRNDASFHTRQHFFKHPEDRGVKDAFPFTSLPLFPFDYEKSNFSAAARFCKECGSSHFKAKRYTYALAEYYRAIAYVQYGIYAMGRKNIDAHIRANLLADEENLNEMFSFGLEYEGKVSENLTTAAVCNASVCPVPWDFRNGCFNSLLDTLDTLFDRCLCEGTCGCQPLKQELMALLNNLCAAYLAMKAYDKVLKYTTNVLRRSSKEVKALFRRGCAQFELSDYDDAIENLTAALELAPQDVGIQRKLAQVRRANAQRTQKQQRALARMFDSSSDQT